VINQNVNILPSYPFPRLRELLAPFKPEDSSAALNMSLGEPQHAVPEFVAEIMYEKRHDLNRYPPVAGTEEWQDSVTTWFSNRYDIPSEMMTADHVVPLNGSREGLFSIGQVIVPQEINGKKPAVLLPNPFYQPYVGSAIFSGADAVYFEASKDNNFMPDFYSADAQLLSRTAMIFLCSPTNPHGTVASMEDLKKLILFAREHKITLLGDECYSEIWDKQAPAGILEACVELAREGKGDQNNVFAGVICFNSLSKRSNLAGLRSGFVAGDPDIMTAYKKLRAYGGAVLTFPSLAASAAAWNDEDHVVENRALYREKFDLAEKYFKGKANFYRPAGGFCLWLETGNGVETVLEIWKKFGIRALPGSYIASTDAEGNNPGDPYFRLVLVHDNERLEAAFKKIASIL
jgi:aspartate/methionine/tyrosine aminotransferase